MEIAPEYEPALLRIEHADRLQILYWMHELSESDRQILTVHPRGNRSRPKRGVFAVRSPMRPNPIGSTIADLIEVDGLSLRVSGLDAHEGSPILDIKIAT
ncbi:MAG: tRNA (N6-threonylcarbamoyladenosine(37)-N6)-methyltransferase TrmO [Planctomycetes bacterium]|nr:tRNA (N6-threonylcarbamoyladenosine(37)-N6)-methyltransferase TrmO [Planctomycetota bacterium]